MEGFVTVESELGKGSAFTVEIPLEPLIEDLAPNELDRSVALEPPDGGAVSPMPTLAPSASTGGPETRASRRDLCPRRGG